MAAVMSTVILEPEKIKSVDYHCFRCFPVYQKWWNLIPWPLCFECWVLSQLFHSLLSPSSGSSLVPLHFLLLLCCVSHSVVSLCNPMDCSPPGFSVPGILQARILEWFTIFLSISTIRVVSSAYLRLLIFLRQTWFQLVLHPAQHFSWCTLLRS